MKRWERTECGKSPKGVDGWEWYILNDDFEDYFRTWEQHLIEMGKNNPNKMGEESGNYGNGYVEFALYNHFEVPNSFGDVQEMLQNAIRKFDEYFFGDWRNAYQASPNEGYTRWLRSFRAALLSSLLLRNAASLEKFAGWVGDDLEVLGDPGFSQNDIDWYIVLGTYILDPASIRQSNPHAETIKKSPRRRPKILLECLTAIDKNDATLFGKTISKKVANFVKSDIKAQQPHSPSQCLDFDASILWNLAEQRKMDMPSLGDEVMDRIVTRKTMGLEK